MPGGFFEDERGQGAIEYILLAGGIIVAAVVVFSVYSRMIRGVGESVNESAERAGNAIRTGVNNEIVMMY